MTHLAGSAFDYAGSVWQACDDCATLHGLERHPWEVDYRADLGRLVGWLAASIVDPSDVADALVELGLVRSTEP